MRRFPRLAALVSALVIAAPAVAQERQGQTVPQDVELTRDVEYGKPGDRALKLDVLRAKDAPEGKRPLIVWVHGGAWRTGDKESGYHWLVPFVRRGYVGAAIQYRLSHEATFPAQIEDCKAAIRFLRAHADEYGIDPDRIGVFGHSAGGHLVALLGTTGDRETLESKAILTTESSRVQAVCDFCGPTDFLAMIGQPSGIDRSAPDCPEALLVGGPIAENREKVAVANPITYISKDDPPFLIMHGDQDKTVPINQSQLLADALKQAGVPVEYHVVEGAGHGFAGPEIRSRVEAFFDRNLK